MNADQAREVYIKNKLAEPQAWLNEARYVISCSLARGYVGLNCPKDVHEFLKTTLEAEGYKVRCRGSSQTRRSPSVWIDWRPARERQSPIEILPDEKNYVDNPGTQASWAKPEKLTFWIAWKTFWGNFF